MISRRQLNFAGFLACALLIGGGLFFQYGLKLVPCNMCVLQRIAVVQLGLLFLLAAMHNPRSRGARVYAALIAVAAILEVALSARHVWMQMQPAGSLPSCGADFFTMVDMLPFTEVVTRIVNGGGECQAIVWSLFGLSMPAWLGLIVSAVGVAGVVGNVRRMRE